MIICLRLRCLERSLVVVIEVVPRVREIPLNLSHVAFLPVQTLAGFEVDANDFHEKMELCDVCGSFLVIGDTQCRVDAHLLGKQHLGFARIRAAITELRVSKAEGFTSRIHSLC